AQGRAASYTAAGTGDALRDVGRQGRWRWWIRIGHRPRQNQASGNRRAFDRRETSDGLTATRSCPGTWCRCGSLDDRGAAQADVSVRANVATTVLLCGRVTSQT